MSFKYLIENVAPETNLQVQTGKKVSQTGKN